MTGGSGACSGVLAPRNGDAGTASGDGVVGSGASGGGANGGGGAAAAGGGGGDDAGGDQAR